MTTRMKTLKWILLTGLSAVVLFGCTKEERYALTAIDKQMVPYQKGDVVRFIDEKGRLSTLPVVVSEIKWDEEKVKLRPAIAECKTVRLESERDEDLWLYMTVRAWTTAHEDNRFISISKWSFIGSFRIYYDSEGRFRTDAGQYQYVYDSIDINHYVYYDVCFVRGWDDARRELYYNKDYGVLQVKDAGKSIFKLVP